MNTIEGILSELGDEPLSGHKRCKRIRVFLNVSMRKDLPNRKIELTDSGYDILALIYEMSDVEQQNLILAKDIYVNADKHASYKTALTVMTIIVVVIVLGIVISSLYTNTPITEENSEIFKLILTNVFEVIKHVMELSSPPSP